jgi:hypothetical protein
VKKDAAGLESHYESVHPEWLFFVDEVGSNMSQAKDGAIGGQTYLCSKTGWLQNHAAMKDAHFTVLGFKSVTGKPLMCAIIFSGKIFKEEWRLGSDSFAEWINPFLLLDGHASRFDLIFLQYINQPETKWNCSIGLPSGTSYWQVGDSSKQNRLFKMALVRAKQEFIMKKNDAGLEFAINKQT